MESLIEEMMCPICLECFTNPVMLTCHHTFCLKCINLFFKFSNNKLGWKINCPICRSKTFISCGSNEIPANYLPKNYIIDNMSSKYNKIKNNESSCDTPGLENSENDFNDKSYCKLHKKNMIKYFCKTCHTLICRVCTIMNHREHDLVFPHEVVISHQEQLSKQYEEILSNHKKMDISINTIDIAMKDIKSRYEEILEQIEKEVQKAKALLECRKQEIIQSLNKIFHQKIKKLNVQKDLIDFEFGKSKITINNAEGIMTTGNAIEKLYLKTVFQNHIKNFNQIPLEPEEDDTIIYELPEKSTDMIIESLGYVEAKSTFAEISFAYGDSLEEAKLDRDACFNVVARSKTHQLIDHEGLVNVSIQSPTGDSINSKITKLENGEFFVNFRPKIKGKHKIHVNLKGRPIQKSPFVCNVISYREYGDIYQPKIVFGMFGVGQKQFKSPLGITCDKESRIFVSDCYNHRVQILGSEGDLLYIYGNQAGRKGYLSNPSGLAFCSKSQRIFICDTSNSKIQCMNLHNIPSYCSNQQPIACPTVLEFESNKANQIKSPSGIAISSQNQEIAVCDSVNNVIQIFNKDGIYLTTIGDIYGVKKLKDGKTNLNGPTYLTYQEETNLLYISDSKNHRIVIYDRRIKSPQRIIQKTNLLNVNNPKGLAFDHSNNLVFINSGTNSIHVINQEWKEIHCLGGIGNASLKFSSPEDLCILPNGDIAITDCCNNRVVII